MSSTIEEYIDEQSGMRLTIERVDPAWPRFTAYPPEPNTLTSEEMAESIKRLFTLVEARQKERAMQPEPEPIVFPPAQERG